MLTTPMITNPPRSRSSFFSIAVLFSIFVLLVQKSNGAFSGAPDYPGRQSSRVSCQRNTNQGILKASSVASYSPLFRHSKMSSSSMQRASADKEQSMALPISTLSDSYTHRRYFSFVLRNVGLARESFRRHLLALVLALFFFGGGVIQPQSAHASSSTSAPISKTRSRSSGNSSGQFHGRAVKRTRDETMRSRKNTTSNQRTRPTQRRTASTAPRKAGSSLAMKKEIESKSSNHLKQQQVPKKSQETTEQTLTVVGMAKQRIAQISQSGFSAASDTISNTMENSKSLLSSASDQATAGLTTTSSRLVKASKSSLELSKTGLNAAGSKITKVSQNSLECSKAGINVAGSTLARAASNFARVSNTGLVNAGSTITSISSTAVTQSKPLAVSARETIAQFSRESVKQTQLGLKVAGSTVARASATVMEDSMNGLHATGVTVAKVTSSGVEYTKGRLNGAGTGFVAAVQHSKPVLLSAKSKAIHITNGAIQASVNGLTTSSSSAKSAFKATKHGFNSLWTRGANVVDARTIRVLAVSAIAASGCLFGGKAIISSINKSSSSRQDENRNDQTIPANDKLENDVFVEVVSEYLAKQKAMDVDTKLRRDQEAIAKRIQVLKMEEQQKLHKEERQARELEKKRERDREVIAKRIESMEREEQERSHNQDQHQSGPSTSNSIQSDTETNIKGARVNKKDCNREPQLSRSSSTTAAEWEPEPDANIVLFWTYMFVFGTLWSLVGGA